MSEELEMGELIGPERLAELRAAREQAIEDARLHNPSNENRGQGLAGLLADIQGLNRPQRDTIRELFGDGDNEDG